MISKKVHLSLSEEEVAKFDMLRNELGMNRSQYFCYLLSGQKKHYYFVIFFDTILPI